MFTINPDEDLMSLQISLEEGMTQRGAERYIRDVSKAVQTGREESTSYGTTILSHRLEVLAKAIQEWKDAAAQGAAGPRSLTYPKVKDVPAEMLAFLTLKSVLSGISSLRTLQFVGVAIGTAINKLISRAADRKALVIQELSNLSDQ